MKKSICYILSIMVLANCFISLAISADNKSFPFTDVHKSAWYYDEVKTIYEKGYMEGKSNGIFDPSANMSRAEFVTVLCRLSEDEYSGKGISLSFTDTETDAWYADYVAWGVQTDMVRGLPGNKFAPTQVVSRQEMAVFIDRFISYKEIELIDNSVIPAFKDSAKVASYAAFAVETMRMSGIITGDENGNYNPSENASRAEVAAVISRLVPMLNNSDVTLPNISVTFALNDEKSAPLPYYIYLPENYDSESKYPLVVFSHENGIKGIDTVKTLFSHKDSPVYDSIVIIPKTKNYSENHKVDELIEYINNNYSTDSERVYMVAVNDNSTFDTWKILIDKPNILSGVIFVYGISAPLATDENGEKVLLDEVAYDQLPDALKDISISIIHCPDDPDPTDQEYIKNYGNELYSALLYSGFENVELWQPENRYATIHKDFVNENDISQLEWLFAQSRKTR